MTFDFTCSSENLKIVWIPKPETRVYNLASFVISTDMHNETQEPIHFWKPDFVT